MTVTRRALSLIRANGVTEPAGTPSTSISSSGLPKLEPVAAERLVQGLEVDMCMAQRHDKEQAVLLVLEEQVLGVPAGQLALQLGAFRHREHGRVLDRLGCDAEVGEARKQVLSGGGHRGWTLTAGRCWARLNRAGAGSATTQTSRLAGAFAA